jgi:hypothetical protein
MHGKRAPRPKYPHKGEPPARITGPLARYLHPGPLKTPDQTVALAGMVSACWCSTHANGGM